MADNWVQLAHFPLHSYKDTEHSVKIVRSNVLDLIYIGLCRKSKYTDAEGIERTNYKNYLLGIPTALALLERLPLVIGRAQALADGVLNLY